MKRRVFLGKSGDLGLTLVFKTEADTQDLARTMDAESLLKREQATSEDSIRVLDADLRAEGHVVVIAITSHRNLGSLHCLSVVFVPVADEL